MTNPDGDDPLLIADPNHVYREMTRPELDAAYNNGAAVSDSPQYLDTWTKQSAIIRSGENVALDLRYGPQPNNRLDFFKCTSTNCGVFIFIHGGYWQRNNKEIFAFVAEGLCTHDVNVATIGYTLAPEASLTDIVQELQNAIDYLIAHADQLGFNPDNIFIGGWSAGGHLSAILAHHPLIKGFISISGIFDLEPISKCYLNEKLQLSNQEIDALSPLNHQLAKVKKIALFVGNLELPELQRQSLDYARAQGENYLHFSHTPIAGKNHFSILDELWHENGLITRKIVDLMHESDAVG